MVNDVKYFPLNNLEDLIKYINQISQYELDNQVHMQLILIEYYE